MTVNLPIGYYHAALFFSGAALPQGAAITFGGQDIGVDSAPHDLALAINTAWATNLDPVNNSEVTYLGCRVKKGPMEDGPFATASVTNAGQVASAMPPPNVCYLVRKHTALGGKIGSGRMYVPGLAEPDVDSAGNVQASKVTTFQNAWSAFLAALATANQPMALLHTFGTYEKKDGTVVTVPAREPTLVSSLVVDPRCATQRRRLR
jgi:hypothetical protein